MKYLQTFSLLLTLLCIGASANFAQASLKDTADYKKQWIEILESPAIQTLYKNTYDALFNRMTVEGFLPESVSSNRYSGMYPRTAGAYVLTLLETDHQNQAERILDFVLQTITKHQLEYVPHVINLNKFKETEIEDDMYQVDAQAHIVLAWAKLAKKRGHTTFEDKTWQQMIKLTNQICGRGSLLYSPWSGAPNLVLNTAFEHSRDGHYWVTYDLLTQSFVAASLSEMIDIAERRGHKQLVDQWRDKLNILQTGIQKNMIIEREGKPTYIEMLIPNGNGGDPYMGMGWVNFSPVAADWKNAEDSVLRNTVHYMKKHYLQRAGKIYWMPTDIFPDGTFVNEVIGKGIAWELDFARSGADDLRIRELLELIEHANKGKTLYMEFAWLEGEGYKRNTRIRPEDVNNKMQSIPWSSRDAGNGEQNAWFCWAMARLRKAAGMKALP